MCETFWLIEYSIATSFVISRRRMVVPIYKKWEATLTRIQIVKQEKVVQLLAFFHDFNHGRCMNFVLKGTDSMESFMRSGKFWIRYVDAKFALPKTEEDPSSDFLCLDMPEYPIEHDDISIAFDSEAGKQSSYSHSLPTYLRSIDVLTEQTARISRMRPRGPFESSPVSALSGDDDVSWCTCTIK